MFELAEEAFDLVALAVERLAEAWLPFAVGLGGDVRHRALGFDQVADAVCIISLVGEDDRARMKAVEQVVSGRSIVRLASGQAEPDGQALAVDERVDLGRKTAPGAAETMISTPLFAVAACWCARMEVLSIIWMSPS